MKKWIYNILPLFLLSILVCLAIFLPRSVSDYFDSHMFDKLYTQSIPKTSLPNLNITLSVADKLNLIRQYGLNTSISRSHSGTYTSDIIVDTNTPVSTYSDDKLYDDWSHTLFDEATVKFQNFLDGKQFYGLDNINEELITNVKKELTTLISYQIIPPFNKPEDLSLKMINCFTYTNINNMDEYVCVCYFKFSVKGISIDLLYDLDSHQIYQYLMSGKTDKTNYLDQGLDDDTIVANMKKGMCDYLNLNMTAVESLFSFGAYTSISDYGNVYGIYNVLLND